ncbi:MAG: DUF5076 domain-containing protein [Alphaproteobacteria bacterium]|nr:DUF5076 domain-containing protein [Alphaproteobacteria bacterium]MBU2380194.1 DUF5076 domain-containing protein [Alphaproteobacteria bacterium]
MTHKYSLPEADAVQTGAEDGSILELARIWATPEGPLIMVRPAYDEPRAMGQVMAELCWNFAEAYSQEGKMSHAEALAALRQGWVEGQANGDAAQKQRNGQ